MSVFSPFKRGAQADQDRAAAIAPAQGGDDSAEVLAARTRARRRLIGAVVLLAIGIVAFPLLFETQPRPLPLNVPIERSGQSTPPPTLPNAAPTTPATPSVAAPPVRRGGAVETERADGSVVDAEPPAKPAAAVAAAASAPAGAASVASMRPPLASAPQGPAAKPARSAEAARAQALLEGKPVADEAPPRSLAASSAAASEGTRFVVQAGAFSDSTSLRAARQKVEKLGLKTYTQVVQTDAGERTRVRVGPYASRDEAERAAAQIKGSGLAANVLGLQ